MGSHLIFARFCFEHTRSNPASRNSARRSGGQIYDLIEAAHNEAGAPPKRAASARDAASVVVTAEDGLRQTRWACGGRDTRQRRGQPTGAAPPSISSSRSAAQLRNAAAGRGALRSRWADRRGDSRQTVLLPPRQEHVGRRSRDKFAAHHVCGAWTLAPTPTCD